MDLHLNDLSLGGQFDTRVQAVDALLGIFAKAQKRRFRLVVSRGLLSRPAVGTMSLINIIAAARQTERALLLNWLGKSGPFSDDEPMETADDLWWLDEDDVTDQGLGAAGRKLLVGEAASSFSLTHGSSSRFEQSPLEVLQGLPGEPLWIASVVNYWELAGLEALDSSIEVEPENWDSFISTCISRYPNLMIDEQNFTAGLKKHPFHRNVVRRGFVLLKVLDDLAGGIGSDGALSEPALRLLEDYFQGGKALFSDEEPQDKHVFIFRDNSNGSDIYCSWHGKVKTPQFRLHFQWPVPVGQRYIKVLYFGEKLTKW